jgi:hypothetical protein
MGLLGTAVKSKGCLKVTGFSRYKRGKAIFINRL